jgi:hypothetical protein
VIHATLKTTFQQQWMGFSTKANEAPHYPPLYYDGNRLWIFALMSAQGITLHLHGLGVLEKGRWRFGVKGNFVLIK